MQSDEPDCEELRRFHRHPLTQRLNRELLQSLERWQNNCRAAASENEGDSQPSEIQG
jgi:uncharacterized Zn finger protein